MNCTIEWKPLKFTEWEYYFGLGFRPNLLQYHAYGRAVCSLYNQRLRRGLIKIDGHAAGIVQIQEVSILKQALHAVIIDRGPLWFEGCGTPENMTAFAATLNKHFPRRWGRRRRFIPETQDGKALSETGFKPVNQNGYQTIWLDLRLGNETLLANLNVKWRNKLRKAEKAGLEIEWDDKGAHFQWLLGIYANDKQTRVYDGPSPKLLTALAKTFVPEKNMLIGRAVLDNKPVAAILVLVHGKGATYQIGWSSPDGRTAAAHHLLLWDVLGELKNRGVKDFDLGGVNDESAQGVKKFKQGMGGELVRLAGLYS